MRRAVASPEAEQIERVLHSAIFQGSETLSRLLRYLYQSWQDDPHGPKEYKIAIEVFGRSEDFDPRTDSSVRVQVARLRAKLVEYAHVEGMHDPLEVEIPKGSYRITFSRNVPEPADVEASFADELSPETHGTRRSSADTWKLAAQVLGIALIAMALLWAYSSAKRNAESKPPTAAPMVDPVVREFWAPFARGAGEETLLIFSNALFVGRPDQGMRYYHPGDGPEGEASDHYTGVGEALAIHQLDDLFHRMNTTLRVKRGALLSMDDIRNTNLIFAGAPVENLVLNDVPNTREFKFRVIDKGPRKGDVEIVDTKAAEGQGVYRNSGLHPLTDDYSIIARFPATDPERSVIITAGTTTLGTEAAVEFLCNPDSLAQLKTKLGNPDWKQPFEAVIHTKVARGVPLTSELVAARVQYPSTKR